MAKKLATISEFGTHEMLRYFTTTLLATLLMGCAMPTSKDVADQWVGKNIGQAIAKLGPPQNTTSIPGGITIYTWEKTYGSANATVRSSCRTGLHADKDGKIVEASQLSESLLCK